VPGIAASCSRSWRKNATRASSLVYRAAGSCTVKVSTPPGSIPPRSARNCRNVRSSSVAATSSTSESPICPTTMPWRTRLRPPVGALRTPSQRAGSPRDHAAGSTLNTTAAASVTPPANSNARTSRVSVSSRGRADRAGRKLPTNAAATPMPAMPPTTASANPSPISVDAARPPLAPSAARIASSRRRASARVTSRLATFPPAITRTTTAAPNSSTSVSRRDPTIASTAPSTCTPTIRCESGYWACKRAAIAVRSARATASVVPARIRPMPSSPGWLSRFMRSSPPSRAIGVHNSEGPYTMPSGKRNPSGITAVTVNGTPSSVIVRPTMSGPPPNRRCQSEWEIATTGGDPGASSAARKSRPRSGRTPNVANRFAETIWPRIRSGSPSARRATFCPTYPASDDRDFDCAWKSTRSGYDTEIASPFLVWASAISCSDAAYGRGRANAVSTTLYTAVVAPMPIAMVSTVVDAKTGERPRDRRAGRTEWWKASSMVSFLVRVGRCEALIAASGRRPPWR
jgi:hypothetical protein